MNKHLTIKLLIFFAALMTLALVGALMCNNANAQMKYSFSDVVSITTGDSAKWVNMKNEYTNNILFLRNNTGTVVDSFKVEIEVGKSTTAGVVKLDTVEVGSIAMDDSYITTNMSPARATALGVLRMIYTVPVGDTRAFKLNMPGLRCKVTRLNPFISGNTDDVYIFSYDSF